MPVAIRLSRVGTKHVPFYRVVVVDSRKKRDGAVIEVLGTYDGIKTKLVNFKKDRYDDWVSKGAQPSDSAKKVYKISRLQEAGKLPEKPVKAAPKAVAKKQTEVSAQAPAEKLVEEPKAEEPKKEAKKADAPEASSAEPAPQKQDAPAKPETKE